MIPSQRCIDLVKDFESLRRKAYLDPVGVPTIGYGTIRYPDGREAQLGDSVTIYEAEQLLAGELAKKALAVSKLVTAPLTQGQFDALSSFTYNLGEGALKSSTLLRKVNADPNDPTIPAEFLRWNRAGGQVLRGLTRRRKAEADLYAS